MKNIVEPHPTFSSWFLSRFTYSGKIKFIIAITAFTYVIVLVNLVNNQRDLLQDSFTQHATAKYYNALMNTILALDDEVDIFEDSINKLRNSQDSIIDQVIQNDKKAQQILGGVLGEIRAIYNSSTIHKITQISMEREISKLIKETSAALFEINGYLYGTDFSTYQLGYAAYQVLPKKIYSSENGKALQNKTEELSDILYTQYSALLLRQYISVASIILGLLIVISLYFTRIMLSPLADLKHAAHQLTRGDLSQRAPIASKDEVAKMCQAFNTMAALLEKGLKSISSISSKLTETILAISTKAKLIELNVTDQEKTIAQIAINTSGITKSAKEVAKAIEAAHHVATESSEFASSAQGTISDMKVILLQSAEAAKLIVHTLVHLEEKVRGVNTIINTLVNVADQANLLAINTALIAHTTRHKRSGFGIIADKIQELASQTAFVTLKMEESVNSILSALSKAVAQVQHLSQQIEVHSRDAASIIGQFSELITLAKQQMATYEKVHTEIKQQEASTEQIHNTISLLSQGAKITTRSVRNLYCQIQALGEVSTNLQGILDRFHLTQ